MPFKWYFIFRYILILQRNPLVTGNISKKLTHVSVIADNSVRQSINQSVNQLYSWLVRQAISLQVDNHTIDWMISQSISEEINQSVSQESEQSWGRWYRSSSRKFDLLWIPLVPRQSFWHLGMLCSRPIPCPLMCISHNWSLPCWNWM